MKLQKKLATLADAAKYATSFARSGSMNKDSLKGKGKGIGSTSRGMSIYHSYTPGGRCISLLKKLLTNFVSTNVSTKVSINVVTASIVLLDQWSAHGLRWMNWLI